MNNQFLKLPLHPKGPSQLRSLAYLLGPQEVHFGPLQLPLLVLICSCVISGSEQVLGTSDLVVRTELLCMLVLVGVGTAEQQRSCQVLENKVPF